MNSAENIKVSNCVYRIAKSQPPASIAIFLTMLEVVKDTGKDYFSTNCLLCPAKL